MANYPIPSWLGPGAAAEWGDLAAKGQQLTLERARIQQAGVNANIEAQARREQQQAEAGRQQQQIQFQKAYRDAELGLRQQSLDLQGQKLQEQAQTAARKSSAMMRISQRIAAGEDPSTVYMQEGPNAGMTADAMARIGTRASATIPQSAGSEGGSSTAEAGGSNIKGFANVPAWPAGAGWHATQPPAPRQQTQASVPEVRVLDNGMQVMETSRGHWKSLGNIYDQKTPKAAKPALDTSASAKILYDENGDPVGKSFKMTDGSYGAPKSLSVDERDALAKAAKNKPKIPDAAIQHLKDNPDLKDDFDKKYGAGASDQYLSTDTEPETP